MKKGILCVVLAIGLLMLGATSSWAGILLFDGTLKWRTGGTVVVDQTSPPPVSWNIGNPTGSDLIEVFQKDFILVQGDEVRYPSLLGMTKFTWGVVNDSFAPIYSFHVKGQGFRPFDYGVPTSWYFETDDDNEEYYFWTETSPIGGTGRRDFYVITNAPEVGFGTAAVDTWNDSNQNGRYDEGEEVWHDGGGLWVATHPAPEPSSMLLLGIGLFGFAGGAVRKRFIA